MCCTPWASQPLFCWLGMLEKVRMISGISKQQPGLPGKPRKGPPDAKFSLFTSQLGISPSQPPNWVATDRSALFFALVMFMEYALY